MSIDTIYILYHLEEGRVLGSYTSLEKAKTMGSTLDTMSWCVIVSRLDSNELANQFNNVYEPSWETTY